MSISSANLNQRSLDGSRDTELGMGSWQPAHTLANAHASQDNTAAHGQPATATSSHPAAGYHGNRGSGAADHYDGGGGAAGGYLGNGRPEAASCEGNCNEASPRGSLHQHQPIGSQPQGQWQNQEQWQKGRHQALDQKQERDSGRAQGLRLPEQEGQRQGNGPGQTQGQGQNQQGDSEPKVAYPKGEVYGYRMSLWLEHLGGEYHPVYDQPHSLACVKRVNYLAEQNWLQFSGEEDCDITGHLITFPIIVDQSGAVSARTVNGQFEDIDNTIKGKKQPIPAIFLN